MTFTQLEYILAIDTHRHFAKAAVACFITQPTLSMQVGKLEKTLGVKIFDRTRSPVVPTDAGKQILEQAKKILLEKSRVSEIISMNKGLMEGELRIGIIPTLAPYLLPLFVQSFLRKYPKVKLVVYEKTTESILDGLDDSSLDAGILVTPLNEQGVKEEVLFYEELLVYVSENNGLYQKTYVMAREIDPNKLWLLEEGHCFRTQMIRLCELFKASRRISHSDYEAGSFETLRRMVELNDGITILPELATLDFSKRQQGLIRRFRKPFPMREVSLVVKRDFVKERLVQILKEEIMKSIPDKIKKNKEAYIVPL
jgi:LysR family transcriptional regulator, hydrogen peroxide-inducible genes activator